MPFCLFPALIFSLSIKPPSSLLHPQPILSLAQESRGVSASATEESSSRRTPQRLWGERKKGKKEFFNPQLM